MEENKKEEVKSVLKGILISGKGRISIRHLDDEYFQQEKRALGPIFKSWGYVDWDDKNLQNDFSDTFYVDSEDGELFVSPVVNQSTYDLSRLIQNTQSKKS